MIDAPFFRIRRRATDYIGRVKLERDVIGFFIDHAFAIIGVLEIGRVGVNGVRKPDLPFMIAGAIGRTMHLLRLIDPTD